MEQQGAGSVPQQARDYLRAVQRYYQPGITRPPRNADIAAAHVPRLKTRTWDRRKDLLRSCKLGGRDWIEVWPPPPDWHPSWEALLPAPPPPKDDGQVHLTYDETYDKDGKLIERRLVRTLGHLGAVAALFCYAVLDLSDGRLDHSFRVCKFVFRAIKALNRMT